MKKEILLLIALIVIMPLTSAFSLKSIDTFRYDPKCWDNNKEYREWYDSISPYILKMYEKYGIIKIPIRPCDMPDPFPIKIKDGDAFSCS